MTAVMPDPVSGPSATATRSRTTSDFKRVHTKSLVFACISGALCAASSAQPATSAGGPPSVSVIGAIDAYVGRQQLAGDPSARPVLNGGGLTTSWIGLVGKEDLGGGLAAEFALMAFINSDSGAIGRYPGDSFFSRASAVGLSGSFGSIRLGRTMAPNFLPRTLFNPFADSTTFSPLQLHANIPLQNPQRWTPTTPSDTGWPNAISYATPSWRGLNANLHYQFDETGGNSSLNNIGFNLNYRSERFAATYYYERDELGNAAGMSFPFPGNSRKTDWMLGGSYDFSGFKLYATSGESKSDALSTRARTLSLGASATLGAGQVLVATAQTKLDTPTGLQITRHTTSAGYDYFLSKSTDIYAIVMRDSISNLKSGTSFGLGLRKRF